MITFHIITVEPSLFPGILGTSLIGKAIGKAWNYNITSLRDFGIGKHKTIDDSPFGGGPGLVIRPDVLGSAIDSIINKHSIDAAYYLSPKGILLNQPIIKEISKDKNIIFICGRFEGIDERVIKIYNLIEVSIGDYVLSNGDLAAMVIIDSIVRLLPGVIGNEESYQNDSFFDGYRHDYPSYTRPATYRGNNVPGVLISGNHAEISRWRKGKQNL